MTGCKGGSWRTLRKGNTWANPPRNKSSIIRPEGDESIVIWIFAVL